VVPPDAPGSEPGQIVELQDYLWVPVSVKRTPTLIECTFQVMVGAPAVHAELLSHDEFRRFRNQQDYEALEATKPGRVGGFSHMVQARGRYEVVIVNGDGAPPAAVSYSVRTTVDPQPSTVSVGIPPGRQFAVIFAALTFLFGTVTWSGHKLLRAWRNR
jgi:hypothetical protein